MLFGVAYFKQIKVTAEMRNKNPELTRSSLQKAVCIISYLPLFGYLKFKLMLASKPFYEKFTDFKTIKVAYEDISKHVTDSWPSMTIH